MSSQGAHVPRCGVGQGTALPIKIDYEDHAWKAHGRPSGQFCMTSK
jgi:hypothetical protein